LFSSKGRALVRSPGGSLGREPAQQNKNQTEQIRAKRSTAQQNRAVHPDPGRRGAQRNKTKQRKSLTVQCKPRKKGLQTSQTDAKHNDRPKGGATM